MRCHSRYQNKTGRNLCLARKLQSRWEREGINKISKICNMLVKRAKEEKAGKGNGRIECF